MTELLDFFSEVRIIEALIAYDQNQLLYYLALFSRPYRCIYCFVNCTLVQVTGPPRTGTTRSSWGTTCMHWSSSQHSLPRNSRTCCHKGCCNQGPPSHASLRTLLNGVGCLWTVKWLQVLLLLSNLTVCFIVLNVWISGEIGTYRTCPNGSAPQRITHGFLSKRTRFLTRKVSNCIHKLAQ